MKDRAPKVPLNINIGELSPSMVVCKTSTQKNLISDDRKYVKSNKKSFAAFITSVVPESTERRTFVNDLFHLSHVSTRSEQIGKRDQE